MPTVMERAKRAWNAFLSRDPPSEMAANLGPSIAARSSRFFYRSHVDKTIITAIRNKIAVDVTKVAMRQIEVDDDGRFIGFINSGLDRCLTHEANIDQTGLLFRQDAVESLLEEGKVALLPIDTDVDPRYNEKFDIYSMRTGEILEYKPRHIRIRAYNERTGVREERWLPKHCVAIVDNPFYPIMNAPNSTLNRLLRKLTLLDAIDEQSGSGKLDLIVQLPYNVQSEGKRNIAETRRKDIESQLAGSKYGIAYLGGTEKVVQLNRAVENNLMSQIEYLTSMLYGQLGLTEAVFDGTADARVMENYYARTIEPIVLAFTTEMDRKFLSDEARSQKQKLFYFRDPFSFIPVTEIANIADKLTRNEIMSPNEIRQVVGMKPSKDPKADELRNRNISEAKMPGEESEEDQNGGS